MKRHRRVLLMQQLARRENGHLHIMEIGLEVYLLLLMKGLYSRQYASVFVSPCGTERQIGCGVYGRVKK